MFRGKGNQRKDLLININNSNSNNGSSNNNGNNKRRNIRNTTNNGNFCDNRINTNLVIVVVTVKIVVLILVPDWLPTLHFLFDPVYADSLFRLDL